MYRIGIIGSENSHAMAFSEIFNLKEAYPDMRVVAVYGEEAEASQKIHDKCGVEVMDSAFDMLDKVDAVMVTSRNGKLHPGYVRPFIEKGIPAFIDKPIANAAFEAQEVIDLAEDMGVPVMGGSSLKMVADTLALRETAQAAIAEGKLLGGHVWAPVNMENPYGNFYFYASHLVEIALTIFGYEPVAVTAVRTAKGVSATLEYSNFAVALTFTQGAYNYGATLITPDGADSRKIEMGDAYAVEVEHYAHMVHTGEMPQSMEDLVKPVYVLNAIERAYTLGTKELI